MYYTTAVILVTTIVLFTIVVMFYYGKLHIEMFLNDENTHLSKNNVSVYLINMSRNKDRFVHFNKMYGRTDMRSIPYVRIDAVDGSKISISKFISETAYKEISEAEKTGHRTKHYQLSRGAVGCYLSHMMVYKHFMKTNKQFLIVFEDDVTIDEQILYKFNYELQHNIPDNWDVTLLGCHCLSCIKTKKYMKIQRFWLTHGLAITRTGVQKILSHIENNHIEQQIDYVISDMAEAETINVYCLNNQLAKQNSGFKTTIQVPIKKTKGVDPYTKLMN